MLPADDVGMENPVYEHHDDCNTPYRSVKYGCKCLVILPSVGQQY